MTPWGQEMIERVARAHRKLARGQVWCCICGRSVHVGPAAATLHGWPKCCGYTMTLDSPEERAMLARVREEIGDK